MTGDACYVCMLTVTDTVQLQFELEDELRRLKKEALDII